MIINLIVFIVFLFFAKFVIFKAYSAFMRLSIKDPAWQLKEEEKMAKMAKKVDLEKGVENKVFLNKVKKVFRLLK